MTTVLITGAAGYIGASLVGQLLARGCQVVAVDRFFFGDPLPTHTQLKKVCADSRRLTDRHFDGVDTVIDLAALSSDAQVDQNPGPANQINLVARQANARMARSAGVSRYILASSCSIHADDGARKSASLYSTLNLHAEQSLQSLATRDFTPVLLRFASAYGHAPRVRFDLCINAMLFAALHRQPITVHGDGQQLRPFAHVSELVAAVVWALTAPASALDAPLAVGSSAGIRSVAEVAALVSRVVVSQGLPEPAIVRAAAQGLSSYTADFGRYQRLNPQAPRITLEDGMRDLARHILAGRAARTPQSLPVSWYAHLESGGASTVPLLHGGYLDIEPLASVVGA